MVDFRVKRPALEALVAARRRRPSTAENINTGLSGIKQGFNLVTGIQGAVEQRRAAKERAKLIALAQQQEEDALTQAAIGDDPLGVLKLRAAATKATSKPFVNIAFRDETSTVFKDAQGNIIPPEQIDPKRTKVFPKKLTVEEEAERKKKLTRAGDLAKLEFKREALTQDLGPFLEISRSIPRGPGGPSRFTAGAKNKLLGFFQSGDVGEAVAQYEGLVLRLRVQLVRAAGDVGNINIVEQEAAQKIIPTLFDSSNTARNKEANLRRLTAAIDAGDEKAVKKALKTAKVEFTDITSTSGETPSGNTFTIEEVK